MPSLFGIRHVPHWHVHSMEKEKEREKKRAIDCRFTINGLCVSVGHFAMFDFDIEQLMS